MGVLEIRFHGRGGQGAKSAAQLLAEAALEEGKQVQAFPEYGPERTGAPVRGFVRISDDKITSYAPVEKPDIVVVIDATLGKSVDVCEGLGESGLIIINTPKNPEVIRKELHICKGQIKTIDSTAISLKHLKRNVPNTPTLGALVKASGIVKLSNLKKVFIRHFEKKIGKELTDANIKMIEEAYELT